MHSSIIRAEAVYVPALSFMTLIRHHGRQAQLVRLLCVQRGRKYKKSLILI